MQGAQLMEVGGGSDADAAGQSGPVWGRGGEDQGGGGVTQEPTPWS